MVSTVIYDSLPERFDSAENRWRMFAVFVFLVSVMIKPRLMIFPFLILYVISGLVREGVRIMSNTTKSVRERRSATKEKNNLSDST